MLKHVMVWLDICISSVWISLASWSDKIKSCEVVTLDHRVHIFSLFSVFKPINQLQFLPNALTLKVVVMPKASQPLILVTMPQTTAWTLQTQYKYALHCAWNSPTHFLQNTTHCFLHKTRCSKSKSHAIIGKTHLFKMQNTTKIGKAHRLTHMKTIKI